MQKLYLLLIFITIITSCTNSASQSNKTNKVATKIVADYEVFNLDFELKEISGITFINDSTIAAIEDENGIVYFYNLNQRKVIRKLTFSEPDDFEDLVKVNEDIYTVTSKGDIYHITSFEQAEPKIIKYTTPLKKKNDIEGITYNEEDNTLLLSVKAENLLGDEQTKSIYSFSLKTKSLNTSPYLEIKHTDLEEQFKGDKLEETSKEFLKMIGNENINKVITPTAMAFHPHTKDLYVLSSVNDILLVFSRKKKLKEIITFKGREFTQPEGLSFNSKGEMFISNEGKKKTSANIIKVKEIR